jgi:hypothetical protein
LAVLRPQGDSIWPLIPFSWSNFFFPVSARISWRLGHFEPRNGKKVKMREKKCFELLVGLLCSREGLGSLLELQLMPWGPSSMRQSLKRLPAQAIRPCHIVCSIWEQEMYHAPLKIEPTASAVTGLCCLSMKPGDAFCKGGTHHLGRLPRDVNVAPHLSLMAISGPHPSRPRLTLAGSKHRLLSCVPV